MVSMFRLRSLPSRRLRGDSALRPMILPPKMELRETLRVPSTRGALLRFSSGSWRRALSKGSNCTCWCECCASRSKQKNRVEGTSTSHSGNSDQFA
jgi:hypothetical protein